MTIIAMYLADGRYRGRVRRAGRRTTRRRWGRSLRGGGSRGCCCCTGLGRCGGGLGGWRVGRGLRMARQLQPRRACVAGAVRCRLALYDTVTTSARHICSGSIRLAMINHTPQPYCTAVFALYTAPRLPRGGTHAMGLPVAHRTSSENTAAGDVEYNLIHATNISAGKIKSFKLEMTISW